MGDRWLVLDAEEPTEQLHQQVGAAGCEGCVLSVWGCAGCVLGVNLTRRSPRGSCTNRKAYYGCWTWCGLTVLVQY